MNLKFIELANLVGISDHTDLAKLELLYNMIVEECATVATRASDFRLPASTYGSLIREELGVE